MTFSSTVSGRGNFGTIKFTWGSYNSAGATTGNIDTELEFCYYMFLQVGGASAVANAHSVDEAMISSGVELPIAGNAITIDTNNNDTGYWLAFGR